MKIAYIDGPRLRRAILAGTGAIVTNAEALNAINVFPVPDGDTGTNMASTARAIAASLHSNFTKEAGAILRQAARSAMEGARGNSGAILAQFLQSLAHELGSEVRIGAKRLAQAAILAAEKTKHALRVPKEGTILTVLDDWARALNNESLRNDDIFHVFFSALDAAKASLERTRNILPEMKKAGVVDAGAKGFVHLLEGIAELFKHGMQRHGLRKTRPVSAINEKRQPEDETLAIPHLNPGPNRIEEEHAGSFRYCTEALLTKARKPLETLSDELSVFGDSLVVAGDEELARVHLHSNTPSAVFDILESFGDLSQHKVDDMELQRAMMAQSKASGAKKRCTIVTDTGCDLPEELMLSRGILKVPALITLGGRTRPDGPALDIAAMHDTMRREPDFSMSTSQPTASSFGRAFKLALSHTDEILYIGLSSALSGTYQAGVTAAGEFGGKVHCYDSLSITAGQGALVDMASEMAELGHGAKEIAQALEARQKDLELFVAVKDLRSLIRTGRLKGVKSLILRKFGLRPVLGTDTQGKAKNRGLYLGETRGLQAIFSQMKKNLGAGTAENLTIVHVAAKADADRLAELCRKELGYSAAIHIADMGPLLASIGWLGALGIAVLRRPS